jgi:hypothetical protein
MLKMQPSYQQVPKSENLDGIVLFCSLFRILCSSYFTISNINAEGHRGIEPSPNLPTFFGVNPQTFSFLDYRNWVP